MGAIVAIVAALSASAVSATVAPGCAESLAPASQITKLRVLAVRAEPPEVAPGEATLLDALVVDPNGPGPAASYLWLACLPAPGQSADVCSNLLMSSLPPDCASAPPASPLCILGSAPTVRYLAPADALDGRPAGATVQVVISVIVQAGQSGVGSCLGSLAVEHRPAADCVVAVKQVLVSRQAGRNHNPTLAALLLDGAEIAAAEHPTLRPLSRHTLGARAAEGAAEPRSSGDGGAGSEDLVLSWFAAAGSLAANHTDFEVDAGSPRLSNNDYAAPATDGWIDVYVVIRDDRGGAGWLWRRLWASAADGGAPDMGGATEAGGPIEAGGAGDQAARDAAVGDMATADNGARR